MFQSATKIRVRYADTDQMGYVYYGNYARFYEIARTEAIRELGLSYKELESTGVMMPVLENFTKYHAPAKYDELLNVKVIIKDFPGVKILFEYEIENEKSELINSGHTLLVFVNMNSGRPCRMPEIMGDLLKPYFQK